jgi:DNA-binding FadR family transcriptional regulator
MIDPDSGMPVYRQLVDEVRAAIERGDLRPGQRLMTEPEYVYEYGISRESVRKAMAALRAEGLIVTTKQGSRVRPQVDVAEVAVGRDTHISTRMPTLQERRTLGVPEGVPVFVIEEPGREPKICAGDRTRLIVHE